MKRASLRVLHVRRRPGARSQAWLAGGGKLWRAALGRSGIKADKREGDGATPAGRFHPLRVWWRADRLPPPVTRLPLRRIKADDAWCEDPHDRRYNRPFKRSASEPGDRLRRADALYDLIVELDHNTRPRAAGRGSAVFIHIARQALAPTAGCIALSQRDLLRLLRVLTPKSRIVVHF